MQQIKEAGSRICSVQHVKVADRFLGTKHRGGFGVCPQCREAYPVADGPFCLACQGEGLYYGAPRTQTARACMTHAQ